MVGSTLGAYTFGLIFVSARTIKDIIIEQASSLPASMRTATAWEGPLNILLWYVPSSRYLWRSVPILFLQEQIKDIIITRLRVWFSLSTMMTMWQAVSTVMPAGSQKR
jgi:hypothetical protein